jgi:hypothetical protein
VTAKWGSSEPKLTHSIDWALFRIDARHRLGENVFPGNEQSKSEMQEHLNAAEMETADIFGTRCVSEGGLTKDPESKKIRWCGRYHKSFLSIDKFSQEGVIGCDCCRQLDAEYAQNAKAKKRNAEREKEEYRKRQCPEGTKAEAGVMTDVEPTVKSGDQNQGQLGMFSNSHL